jgi:FKBP-type peptidyl-prolyl cis-trans isomerase
MLFAKASKVEVTQMKVAITTAVLLVLLGTTTSSYARQEKGQEEHSQGAKPAEQQHAQQQSKPAQQQHAQEQSKPAQQQHVKQQAKPAQQQHAQEQTKPAQQQHVKQQAKPVQQQHAEQGNAGKSQAQAQQSHPAGGNKGNYAHGRISDAHYAASFGSGHRFHISQSDYQHRRFQYGGYSFGFIDPWPVGWGYSDDVYVVYVDGGYYMYDPVHPGLRIAISIF